MATGVRIFLNINNLSPKGESTDAAYQNWIELIDYKMTVKNQSTVSSGTTGSGAGRAVFEGIHCRANINLSTPSLMQACASGMHYSTAVLAFVKPGGSGNVVYLTKTLTEVFLTEFTDEYGPLDPNNPAAGVGHFNKFNLSFATISETYTQQTASGASGSSTSGSYNITTNSISV